LPNTNWVGEGEGKLENLRGMVEAASRRRRKRPNTFGGQGEWKRYSGGVGEVTGKLYKKEMPYPKGNKGHGKKT